MEAIYFDTETTGVDTKNDAIIELAAYNVATKESFSRLIRPWKEIPLEATKVHLITNEMVADAASFAEVAQEFLLFCGKEPLLIAHNGERFDLPILQAEFRRAEMEFPPWPLLDTLQWARRYRPDLPRHTLQYLREMYGIEANQAHRALEDVMILKQLFESMIDDLSFENVIELMKLAKTDMRMPFGKHRGKRLDQLPKDYIRWLQSSGALEERKELLDQFVSLGLL